ncbi:MAG: BrnT family toxin [Firmicutes bacterium]|nr:BrnT family toxin [Bacillota bacterium]
MEYIFNDKRYSWDPNKEKINIQKHGISFIEAVTVFEDDDVKYIIDDKNSMDEDRFLAIGYSDTLKMLSVCHCLRENDELTRIISVRKATKTETKIYGGDYYGL